MMWQPHQPAREPQGSESPALLPLPNPSHPLHPVIEGLTPQGRYISAELRRRSELARSGEVRIDLGPTAAKS